MRFRTRPKFAVFCDTALVGCRLLYSCLSDEGEQLGAVIKLLEGLEYNKLAIRNILVGPKSEFPSFDVRCVCLFV